MTQGPGEDRSTGTKTTGIGRDRYPEPRDDGLKGDTVVASTVHSWQIELR